MRRRGGGEGGRGGTIVYKPETPSGCPFSKLPKLFSSRDVLECVQKEGLPV